jgi:Holliday junction resolvase
MVNSIEKGKQGEREFARLCRDNGYDCRRGQQYNGIDGQDVVGLSGIHVECKRVERLNIYDAMSQAMRDRKTSEIPIVAHRKNNHKWLVTMKAEDWFRLYKEYEAGGNN